MFGRQPIAVEDWYFSSKRPKNIALKIILKSPMKFQYGPFTICACIVLDCLLGINHNLGIKFGRKSRVHPKILSSARY